MNKWLFVVSVSLILLSRTSLFAEDKDSVVQMMKELTEAPGPSGSEGAVREVFVREMRSVGADVSSDGLGSVIARVTGSSQAPRIMIEAHMDEVGLMVRYITEDGFV